MIGWLRKRKRRKIIAAPWDDRVLSLVQRRVLKNKRLSTAQHNRWLDCIKVIAAEKNWEGCDGLEMTDEVQFTIAAHASQLLIGTEDYYFDGIKSILVFPQAFTREWRNGLLVGQRTLSGEAWQGGPIVLSWADVMRNAKQRGHNVVIHEFAHHLDGLDGEMAGSLTFPVTQDSQRWQRVSRNEYERLCDASRHGAYSLLDYYGATNRAEFFAVATEAFFELPREMSREHTELFELMTRSSS